MTENNAIQRLKNRLKTEVQRYGEIFVKENFDDIYFAITALKKSNSTGELEQWKSAGKRWRSCRKQKKSLENSCVVIIVLHACSVCMERIMMLSVVISVGAKVGVIKMHNGTGKKTRKNNG